MTGTYLHRQKRYDQGGDVAQHVETICHQGHRIGNITHYDLHKEEERRQPHHREQPAFLARVLGHFGKAARERNMGI